MFVSLDPFHALSALNAVSDVEKISGQIPSNNKRIYYCQRCLNHGQLEPRKNHKSECLFASCVCQKCILVEKRRVLNSQLHELEENILLSSSASDSNNDFTQHRGRTFTNSSDMASIAEEGDEEILDNLFKFPIISQNSVLNNDSLMMDLNNDFGNDDLNEHGRIKGERVPNCQKCGQHGRKSRLKGHKRVCPFKDCNCPKCQVVSERQKLMADQIKIRRRQRKDTIMNFTREKITATLNAAAAVAAAGPLPYLNNLNLLYNQLNQADATQSTTSPTATVAPVGLPLPPTATSTAMNIPTSLSPSSLTESAPTSLQPSAFLSSSAPTSSYLPSSSTADFLKAAVAMSSSVPDHSNNNNIATSPLQLSQFLFGTSPTAALAALTVANSPPASLPIPSSTPAYDRRSESGSDTSSIASLSSSPTPSSSTPDLFDSLRRRTSSFGAPLSVNPFANLSSTFPTQPSVAANLPTHEQLLAFLANVQLSSCFPGLNLSANEPEGSVTGMDTTPQQLPPNNKPIPAALTTNFVDICSV